MTNMNTTEAAAAIIRDGEHMKEKYPARWVRVRELKDAVFAAEDLAPDGCSFDSCVTVPELRCEGFRRIPDSEIREML